MNKTPPPSGSRSAGSRQLSGLQILFASILAIGLLLAINFSNRITTGQQIQSEREQLEQEIAILETEQAALQQELDYVRSDDYVAAWAREEGKMVREGEVLVVPVPGGLSLVTPTPQPQTLAGLLDDDEPETENWELWWALFFDSPPPF